jgi:Tol biopolymer transport system component
VVARCSELVIATAAGLRIVETEDLGSRIVFGGTTDAVDPSWSPDGKTTRSSAATAGIGCSGSSGSRLAFISDRRHVPGGVTQYQYALYVQTLDGSKPKKVEDDVHPITPPRWSPTGAQLAYAAGQECRRWGIYVVDPDSPQRDLRRSNSRRFVGTAGNDVVKGTPYSDIIRGYAGNDRIEARDGFRDPIDCGPGNDTAEVDGLDVVRGCEHVLRP